MVLSISDGEFMRMKGAVLDKDRDNALEPIKAFAKCLEQQSRQVLKSYRGSPGQQYPSISKCLRNLGLATSHKEDTRVGHRVANGTSILGNLRHWLEDQPEIREIMIKLSAVERRNIRRR